MSASDSSPPLRPASASASPSPPALPPALPPGPTSPPPSGAIYSPANVARDLVAGLVVFLVALPLCLGIALASGTDLFTGLLSGIVGGIVVGWLSGSHTSVSGPAAGLTVIVASLIHRLGSWEAFLLAVFISGLIQIAFGLARGGFIASFVPSGVINGLLTAIGLTLVIGQVPYLLGRVPDAAAGVAAWFSGPLNYGALAIGVLALAMLVLWDRIGKLKDSPFPAPLAVVVMALAAQAWLQRAGSSWQLGRDWLVKVPEIGRVSELYGLLTFPDFGQWSNPAVYVAAVTIATVASLETLLNLEAVDKLDPQRRSSPANRELFAQGVGNVTVGLIGGLPITSVVVRGTVNINAGGRTKLAAIFHGLLMAASVLFAAGLLNRIPLSCLAAILVATGFKLASPKLVRKIWNAGWDQFLPYLITVIAIVATDLLWGILIGLVVSLGFILYSNYRRPAMLSIEKHLGQDLYQMQLANQVSFLNRAAIDRALNNVPAGAHLLIDASQNLYLDSDIRELLRDYAQEVAPVRGVTISLKGFRSRHAIEDRIHFAAHSTSELQAGLTPVAVLQMLREGNDRFRRQQRLPRDWTDLHAENGGGQFPLAVVLGCIDSRTPAEKIFDVGFGNISNIRIAGNMVLGRQALASLEFACTESGVKLVVLMAHTGSPVIARIVQAICAPEEPPLQESAWQHPSAQTQPAPDAESGEAASAEAGETAGQTDAEQRSGETQPEASRPSSGEPVSASGSKPDSGLANEASSEADSHSDREASASGQVDGQPANADRSSNESSSGESSSGEQAGAGFGEHFPFLVEGLLPSITAAEKSEYPQLDAAARQQLCDQIARRNILRALEVIPQVSPTIRSRLQQQRLGMIAAVYHTERGEVEFLVDSAVGFDPSPGDDAAAVRLS